jgi:hypothetical protein
LRRIPSKDLKQMAQRPAHVKPPAYLSKSPPVPQPDPIDAAVDGDVDYDGKLSPTRYGDWEHKGIAVDF